MRTAAGKALARESQNEDHRDDRLHADRDRPSAEPGDEAADEADGADHEERGDRPRQRELDRDGREERQREAEAHRPRLFPPGRGKVGYAGRYRAQGRRLAGGEAEHRGGDERDRDHAQADAQAVDDVLADEEANKIGRARPAKHGPAEVQAAGAVPFNDWTARAATALRPEMALIGEGDDLANHLRRPV